MKAVKILKALGPIDAKNIRRDAMLRWIVLFPVLVAGVLRWGAPWLAATLLEELQFDLSPYYPLMMSSFAMTMPLMIGMVIGFLLLDQRDDNTLSALQVTPLSLNGYLAYRISLPMLISSLVTIAVIPITNLVEMSFFQLLLAALAAAPIAPLAALFLASFARNKVQGFALSKGSGFILVPPLAAYFVDSGWQLAFGLAPTYWPVKLFWVLEAGLPHAWLYLTAGLAYQLLLIFVLMKAFNRAMHS